MPRVTLQVTRGTLVQIIGSNLDKAVASEGPAPLSGVGLNTAHGARLSAPTSNQALPEEAWKMILNLILVYELGAVNVPFTFSKPCVPMLKSMIWVVPTCTAPLKNCTWRR